MGICEATCPKAVQILTCLRLSRKDSAGFGGFIQQNYIFQYDCLKTEDS